MPAALFLAAYGLFYTWINHPHDNILLALTFGTTLGSILTALDAINQTLKKNQQHQEQKGN